MKKSLCPRAALVALLVVAACSGAGGSDEADGGLEQPTGETPTPGTYTTGDFNNDLTIVISDDLRITSVALDIWCPDGEGGGYGREGSQSLNVDVSTGYFSENVADIRVVGTWTTTTTISGKQNHCPLVYDEEAEAFTNWTEWTATLE